MLLLWFLSENIWYVRDNDGRTFVHSLALYASIDTIRQLCQEVSRSIADELRSMPDKDGRTPVELAPCSLKRDCLSHLGQYHPSTYDTTRLSVLLFSNTERDCCSEMVRRQDADRVSVEDYFYERDIPCATNEELPHGEILNKVSAALLDDAISSSLMLFILNQDPRLLLHIIREIFNCVRASHTTKPVV